MKRNYLLVIAVILLFFASVLITMGALTALDTKNQAPIHNEPGLCIAYNL